VAGAGLSATAVAVRRDGPASRAAAAGRAGVLGFSSSHRYARPAALNAVVEHLHLRPPVPVGATAGGESDPPSFASASIGRHPSLSIPGGTGAGRAACSSSRCR
jgi:hypothetical protein